MERCIHYLVWMKALVDQRNADLRDNRTRLDEKHRALILRAPAARKRLIQRFQQEPVNGECKRLIRRLQQQFVDENEQCTDEPTTESLNVVEGRVVGHESVDRPDVDGMSTLGEHFVENRVVRITVSGEIIARIVVPGKSTANEEHKGATRTTILAPLAQDIAILLKQA